MLADAERKETDDASKPVQNPSLSPVRHRKLLPDQGSDATLPQTGTTATGRLHVQGPMGKTNELEQDCRVYPLSLDTAKPPSTAHHAVGQANKNNTIYTTYTRSDREIFPLKDAPFWPGRGRQDWGCKRDS